MDGQGIVERRCGKEKGYEEQPEMGWNFQDERLGSGEVGEGSGQSLEDLVTLKGIGEVKQQASLFSEGGASNHTSQALRCQL